MVTCHMNKDYLQTTNRKSRLLSNQLHCWWLEWHFTVIPAGVDLRFTGLSISKTVAVARVNFVTDRKSCKDSFSVETSDIEWIFKVIRPISMIWLNDSLKTAQAERKSFIRPSCRLALPSMTLGHLEGHWRLNKKSRGNVI